MKILRGVLLPLGVVALAAACGGDNPLAETRWHLVALESHGARDAVLGYPVLEFSKATRDGATVEGTTGCNLYIGAYRVRGQRLRIYDLWWQEAGCPHQAFYRQEDRILEAIAGVERFMLSGDRLLLITRGQQVLMFEREKILQL